MNAFGLKEYLSNVLAVNVFCHSVHSASRVAYFDELTFRKIFLITVKCTFFLSATRHFLLT